MRAKRVTVLFDKELPLIECSKCCERFTVLELYPANDDVSGIFGVLMSDYELPWEWFWPEKVRYCPFCGEEIDIEIEGAGDEIQAVHKQAKT